MSRFFSVNVLAFDAGIYVPRTVPCQDKFVNKLYFQVNVDVHNHHHSEAQQRGGKSDSDQSDNTESDEETYL